MSKRDIMKINARKPSIRKKYKPNFFTTTHNPNKKNQNI
jgi:hypothetical protein